MFEEGERGDSPKMGYLGETLHPPVSWRFQSRVRESFGCVLVA